MTEYCDYCGEEITIFRLTGNIFIEYDFSWTAEKSIGGLQIKDKIFCSSHCLNEYIYRWIFNEGKVFKFEV